MKSLHAPSRSFGKHSPGSESPRRSTAVSGYLIDVRGRCFGVTKSRENDSIASPKRYRRSTEASPPPFQHDPILLTVTVRVRAARTKFESRAKEKGNN